MRFLSGPFQESTSIHRFINNVPNELFPWLVLTSFSWKIESFEDYDKVTRAPYS